MSTFVLVHGAWHGAWCWKRIKPALLAEGHTVYAPDLPGHGKNITSGSVITAADYVHAMHILLTGIEEQVILVGHSMGGMIISRVAELMPEKCSGLVYLSGFLLLNGQSINDLENQVEGSLVAPNMVLSRDKSSLSLSADLLRAAFYSDCDETDYQYALDHVQAQPVLPILAPVTVTAERYGSVPRVYIECLQDRAIPVSAQRLMYTHTKCEKIFTLDCAHSPFFSASSELVRILQWVSTRQSGFGPCANP